MRRPRIALLTLLAGGCLTLATGCGTEEDEAKELTVFTPQGQVVMRYLDLVEGKGEAIKKFDEVDVHYTGWVSGGSKFDSSRDRKTPFTFTVGAGKVIKGWDEGIPGMKVGGIRKLFIPAALGYGDKGAGDKIGPGAKLVFEIEVLKISNLAKFRQPGK